ncbi:Pectate lyase [Rhizoctonia solani]|uniref:pectin lyase n=1 Tax=Rhizoctonia solani TaxID=456999 RepID=A0A8H7I423_9AGAM|nr:Pectate lyase [Rhizoctonia solani]
MITITSLAVALIAAKNVAAVGSPFGFATGTRGGNGAAQAVPTSAAQLKSWLEDNVTRNILLDRTYDFTDTEGSITGTVCKSWNCSPNPQYTIDTGSGCGSSPASTATWKKAGTAGINVKSNKTILGKGTSGWIKGKGLRLSGVSNVIIQNIRISDLNPQYVWGGDALHIENASKVWVDHNYGFGAAKQVTISNNYFDGQSTYSTGCDQHHYWALLFAGNGDQITFARNYLYYTAGRGPHIGVRWILSYFNEIAGHAIDPDTGSKILVEGNYFNKLRRQLLETQKEAAFAPTSASMNSQCSGTLGRIVAGGSGALTNTGSTGILSAFTASVVKSASILDPGQQLDEYNMTICAYSII